MALRLRAEYTNGTLRPLEPLDLEEGAVVTLAIEEEDNCRKPHSALEIADRIRRSGPPAIWNDMPTDASKNYRHYLYGHRKLED